jgi:hypothetical protein
MKKIFRIIVLEIINILKELQPSFCYRVFSSVFNKFNNGRVTSVQKIWPC